MKVLIFCIPIALLSIPIAHSVQKSSAYIDKLSAKDSRLRTFSSGVTQKIRRIEQLNTTLTYLKTSCMAAAVLNPATLAYFRKAGNYVRGAQNVLWKSTHLKAKYFAMKNTYKLKVSRPVKQKIGICFLPSQFKWSSKLIVEVVDNNSGSQIWSTGMTSWNYYNPNVLPIY